MEQMGKRIIKKAFRYWVIVDRLADVILANVEGCIVEIGVGLSTIVLAKHARKFGRKHYAVDKREHKCESIATDPATKHDGLEVFPGLSFDFMKTFDDIPALVLIDGCHDADIVREEAMFFLDRLRPGGIIFFHDMHVSEVWAKRHDGKRKFSDCYLVRWELESRRDLWCFTFPYTAQDCGVTMIMKRPVYEYTARNLDLVYLGKGRRGISGRLKI